MKLAAILSMIFLPALLVCSCVAEDASTPNPDLYHWETAVQEFKKAGVLIGQKKFDDAKESLKRSAETLPEPYASLANAHLKKLNVALSASDTLNGYDQSGQLGELCVSLHAYPEAVALLEQVRTQAPDRRGYSRAIPWSLYHSGQVAGALEEYRQRHFESPKNVMKANYARAMLIIQQRQLKPNDVPVTLQYVTHFLIESVEVAPDYLGALQELKRVHRYARTTYDQKDVITMMMECLKKLRDSDGVTAWEQRLYADPRPDEEILANQYANRAAQAQQDKNLDVALELYRKIRTECPMSTLVEMSWYMSGLVLKEQDKEKEAVAEFTGLLQSKQENYDDSFRQHAALALSDYFEKVGDFRLAINFAKDARSYSGSIFGCGTCLREWEEAMRTRIERLQQKLSQQR